MLLKLSLARQYYFELIEAILFCFTIYRKTLVVFLSCQETVMTPFKSCRPFSLVLVV